MKVLFLDDEISRATEFCNRTGLIVTYVDTYQSFVDALDKDHFDLIMLDHDLGPAESGDGALCAKYLAENRLIVGDDVMVIIHSANSIGVSNMVSHMKHAEHLTVNVVNFAWTKVEYSETAGLKFTLGGK